MGGLDVLRRDGWMKKSLLIAVISLLIFPTAIYVADASFSVESSVEDRIHVAVRLENLNFTIYTRLTLSTTFNSTTIPEKIVQEYRKKGLDRISFYGDRIEYDPLEASIEVSFYLTGLDVLRFRFERETMSKTYWLDMGWRKIVCNITRLTGEHVLTLDFARYFGRPVEEWNQTEHLDREGRVHVAFVYNYTEETGFDPTFKVVLPPGAENIKRSGDRIIFTVPAYSVESAILNPLTVLGIIVLVDISIRVSRRAKKPASKASS